MYKIGWFLAWTLTGIKGPSDGHSRRSSARARRLRYGKGVKLKVYSRRKEQKKKMESDEKKKRWKVSAPERVAGGKEWEISGEKTWRALGDNFNSFRGDFPFLLLL